MTDIWARLAEPFPPDAIKERPGRGGMTFSYVDARIVAQRLDDVVTPAGWDFQVQALADHVAHGRLTLFVGERSIVREDFGYPNTTDDEEPLKSAASDALKRCAVQVGVGRHLYGDNKAGVAHHTTPKQNAAPRPSTAPTGDAAWTCPDHGVGRVKEGKKGGYYCASKRDDGSWCEWNDRNTAPIEPRPKLSLVDPPPLPPPADYDDLPF